MGVCPCTQPEHKYEALVKTHGNTVRFFHKQMEVIRTRANKQASLSPVPVVSPKRAPARKESAPQEVRAAGGGKTPCLCVAENSIAAG